MNPPNTFIVNSLDFCHEAFELLKSKILDDKLNVGFDDIFHSLIIRFLNHTIFTDYSLNLEDNSVLEYSILIDELWLGRKSSSID